MPSIADSPKWTAAAHLWARQMRPFFLTFPYPPLSKHPENSTHSDDSVMSFYPKVEQ
jgi:hypothetical protein